MSIAFGPALSRRAGRLAVGGLALLLAFLAACAVAASWRQTALLEDSTHITDRIGTQFDAMSLIGEQEIVVKAAMSDTPGENPSSRAAAAGPAVLELLNELAAGDDNSADWRRIVTTQEAVMALTDDFLFANNRGDHDTARIILRDDLEPLLEEVKRLLGDEIASGRASYEKQITTVQRDSRVLRAGSVAAVLIGGGTCALLLLAARERRRVAELKATQDVLTGLANRVCFQRGVDEALTMAGLGGLQPTVLMLDLDEFKEVNDTLGHHHGDLLLRQVAERLHSILRPGDTVARLGGDEFAVLLTDDDDGSWGERAAERVSNSLSEPFLLEDHAVDIEASIGIAVAAPGDDVTTIMRHADTAMYTAKANGLDYIRHNRKQDDDTTSRLGLLGAMRRALEGNELEMYYQPKVSVEGEHLLGAEALARWNHPTRGVVAPSEFIPVLETTSLIHRFTDRVLELSLAQVREWLTRGIEVQVSVNVSTRSLLDIRFPARVAEALARADVPARLLCVEVTEHAVMTDPGLAVEVLTQIHDLGVRTSIDDFGTGYSSMSYLKVLPIDEIKVDRSFVMDMVSDPGNHVLVQSTVELGHNLGLSVVAEGVEDAETLAALHRLNCDAVQGYYYARPQPSAAFLEWVHAFGERLPFAPLPVQRQFI